MADNNRTITVGLPLPNRSDYEFDVSFVTRQNLDAMYALMRSDGWDVHESIVRGVNVADHHNQLAKNMKGDWLLICGSDHGFQPNAALQLVEAAESELKPKIVGSLISYRNPPNQYVACLFARDNKHPRPIVPWRDFHPMMAVSGGLMRVDTVGSGFCLYHRSVFDAVPFPWFAYAPYLSQVKLESLLKRVGRGKNGKKTQEDARWLLAQSRTASPYGPDYYFCVKAKDYGIDTYLHFGCRVSHYDYIPVMHHNYIQHMEDPVVWWSEVMRAAAPTEDGIQELIGVTNERNKSRAMSFEDMKKEYAGRKEELEASGQYTGKDGFLNEPEFAETKEEKNQEEFSPIGNGEKT